MKTLTVSALQDGTKFLIPSLEQSMRNLRVVRVGEGSTLIHGQRKNNIDEPWVTFEHAISNSTNVVIDNSVEVVNDVVVETATEKTAGVRGKRKQNVTLVIPDGVFTMRQLAESSGISPALCYLRLQEKIQSNEVWLIGKQSTGRGKPTSFFSKDSNAVLPPLPEKTVKEKTAYVPTGGRKGKARTEVNIILPEGEFTMKDVATASNLGYPLTYLRVMEMVKSGVVKVVGKSKIAGKKGKASIIYSK